MDGSSNLDESDVTINPYDGLHLSESLDGYFCNVYAEFSLGGNALAEPQHVLRYDTRDVEETGKARRVEGLLGSLCDYFNAGGNVEELQQLLVNLEPLVKQYAITLPDGYYILDYLQPHAEFAFCHRDTGQVCLVRPDESVTELTLEQAMQYADGQLDIAEEPMGPGVDVAPDHLEPG